MNHKPGSGNLWHAAPLPVTFEHPLWDLWHQEQVENIPTNRKHSDKWKTSRQLEHITSRGYVICYACLTWSLGQIAFPLVGENQLWDITFPDNFVSQAGWSPPGDWSRLSRLPRSSSSSSRGLCSPSPRAGWSPSREPRRRRRSSPRSPRPTGSDLHQISPPDCRRWRRLTRRPPSDISGGLSWVRHT